jgi:serine/threonine protein kinase
VGRYQLLGKLGRGGMGQVYLGRSPGGRQVAVKLIRPELAGDPDFRARFALEVATARKVSGIFTVPVVDAEVNGTQPWLVTAYVEGPSLAEAVNDRGPLPAASVLSLAAGLAEGLEAIHAAGVVHRDLKPSNVLLAADGPRIIDFGISRAAEGAGFTRTGFVAGSPGFMSPEQAMGGETGPASDVFSLGSVLAFAATGQGPFGRGTAEAMLFRVVHVAPDTAPLPARVRQLVEQCLVKDPRRRPTAGQIVTALAGGQPGPSAEPGPRAEPGLSAQRREAPSPTGFPRRQPPRLPPPAVPHSPAVSGGQPGDPGHPGTWPELPAGQGRRGRGSLVALAAAGVAVLAAVAGTAVALGQHSRPTAAASAGASSATTSPGTPGLASASATASASQLAGWTPYQGPGGTFTIDLPPGWSATSASADEVKFSGPQPGFTALVAWTTQPKPDAYADWEQQSAVIARQGPGYQLIGITQVSYRGWNAADWEFLAVRAGQLDHFLDRGFIVRPGQLAYAIELYGPQAQWPSVKASIWAGLTQSFSPAG